MIIIYFFNGLFFGGLGLAAYLQLRQSGDFPLRKHLPCLAAFGFACGTTYWIDMFQSSESLSDFNHCLQHIRMVLQPITGLLLLRFGWGILRDLTPLPAWTIFIPGVMIVPIAYVITFAATSFITPSPIEIPIDIWTRYLLYLPGSIMAGIGFLRQWKAQGDLGFNHASRLMLGAGMAFLFEAFVVGLIVPAAPYGPASYYNYDRVTHNAFLGEETNVFQPLGLTAWLDYERVLEATGLPIEFWRMLSAIAVTFFIVRGLGVFEAIRKRQLNELQEERDSAQQATVEAQIVAREIAEDWTNALVNINRQIAEFSDADEILLGIVENTRKLLASDGVGLAIWNHDADQLELKFFSIEDKNEIVVHPWVIENQLILDVYKTCTPYRSEFPPDSNSMSNLCILTNKSTKALAAVPLQLVDQTTMGVIWIVRCENGAFSQTDLIWLESMADQVVIALQHGLMAGQLQSLSILEERGRIAREMHDGLAQVLGYLNLQLQTISSLQEQGKDQEVLTELDEMKKAVQVAHADIRENILSLRTTLANEKGLVVAIEEYLTEFGLQTGINTSFQNAAEDELELSSLSEVQLICILQEALTNVRKHAHAKHVTVSLEQIQLLDEEVLKLGILDDGTGFELMESARSFGIKTMQERAQTVNAEFHISSILEHGTMVECIFPCIKAKEMQPRTHLYR